LPHAKALPAGCEATAQLRRLALSATSIGRKLHESVMSSVMAVALNAEQEMSQNVLASKHTQAPELRASSRGGEQQCWHPERIFRRRKSASEAILYKS